MLPCMKTFPLEWRLSALSDSAMQNRDEEVKTVFNNNTDCFLSSSTSGLHGNIRISCFTFLKNELKRSSTRLEIQEHFKQGVKSTTLQCSSLSSSRWRCWTCPFSSRLPKFIHFLQVNLTAIRCWASESWGKQGVFLYQGVFLALFK